MKSAPSCLAHGIIYLATTISTRCGSCEASITPSSSSSSRSTTVMPASVLGGLDTFRLWKLAWLQFQDSHAFKPFVRESGSGTTIHGSSDTSILFISDARSSWEDYPDCWHCPDTRKRTFSDSDLRFLE